MNRNNDAGKRHLLASVVIPSYNRLDILKMVLASLEKQSLPGELFEIIVSDDCSVDGTREFVRTYKRQNDNPFKYLLAEKNGGPACARNSALKEVRGEVVIIIGDDIVVEKDFIEKHLNWHRTHEESGDAVLGFVGWPEEIAPSRFMKWLYDGGRQYFFNFLSFTPRTQIDCQYFYTCNVSVKKTFLADTLFDESFPYASHEDLEFGYRLGKKGMRLFYSDDIVGYHFHRLKISGIAKRVYLMGRSAHIYWQKVPDNSPIAKKLLRSLLSFFASMPFLFRLLTFLLSLKENDRSDYPIRWKTILTLCYWLGMADGRNNRDLRLF